jgi:hypothetical protein
MSLTGEPRLGDPASRRAVFLSTVVAVMLVASALAVGIYMTVARSPQIARTAAAATADKANALPPPLAPDGLGEGALPLPVAAEVKGDTTTSTTTTTPTPTPSDSAAKAATARAAASNATTSATTTARTGPGKRAPAAAASGDLYKPF